MSSEYLLEVANLTHHFRAQADPSSPLGRFGRRASGTVHALDDVSLRVRAGETLGVVGESGCGKSTLVRCMVRLIDPTSGTIYFDGRDITRLHGRALRPVRREMQTVFQDPQASLNPRKRVEQIIAAPLAIHGIGTRKSRRRSVQELLELVGLEPEHGRRFPREFSGGQRQRIGLARALALRPRLIVADEPVSSLDVSIKSEILNLFRDLQDELGLTYVFVAHDFGAVRHMSTRIAVIYLGKIVEMGPTERLLQRPSHPYTAALLSAVPRLEDVAESRPPLRLVGDPPSPINPPSGCRFHPRCPYATAVCSREEPALTPRGDGQVVACHHPLAHVGASASETAIRVDP